MTDFSLAGKIEKQLKELNKTAERTATALETIAKVLKVDYEIEHGLRRIDDNDRD